MYAKVWSFALSGIEAVPVEVEMQLSGGLPGFQVVGLADTAVKESRERIAGAFSNCGLRYPAEKVTVNLAPAGLRKHGPGLDLPIAVSMLAAMGVLPAESVKGLLFLGELSMDGAVRAVRGALQAAMLAKRLGMTQILAARENAEEASAIPGMSVLPVKCLPELLDHLSGRSVLQPFNSETFEPLDLDSDCRLEDVRGQGPAKRALEIAAAGNHNLLLIGAPGTGKTMLARRLSSLLPSLTFEESLEITRIHNVTRDPVKARGLVRSRPFRAPHHTVTRVSLAGGGNPVTPGEISLAHRGVLFLDELAEFSRATLEVLRQPLEEGEVRVSRISGSYVLPSRFLLVAALNPCPCGFRGHPQRACRCGDGQIRRYLGRISGPLLDRIDLQIEVRAPLAGELLDPDHQADQGQTKRARNRVIQARDRQKRRYGNCRLCNADLKGDELGRVFPLDEKSRRLLARAVEKLGMSPRTLHRVHRVAGSISDLEGEEEISTAAVAEALQYRALDRELDISS